MSILTRFFRDHLKPYIWVLLGGSLLLQMAGACQSLMILVLKLVFDENLGLGSGVSTGFEAFEWIVKLKAWLLSLIPATSGLNQSIYFVPVLLVVIFFLKGFFAYSGTMVMVRCGIRATQGLRERLFARTLDQELAFFQQHPVGELIQRSISDVAQVQNIASNQLAEAIRESTLALAMFITVMSMDWRMTLMIFIALPLVIWPIRRLSRRIRKISHRNMEASSLLLQRLKEVFSNIRVVIGFSRQQYEVDRFHRQQHDIYQLGIKAARASAMSHPIMEMVGGILIAVIIILVSGKIQAKEINGSDFLVYLLALYSLYSPLRSLTKLNNEAQTARAGLERIYNILDRPSEMIIPEDPKSVPQNPETLRLENVHFSYDGKHPVLRGIDLEIRRGETIALVGSSGSGKTTFANLIPRFFDPTVGRIFLDGTDIRDFNPGDLRQHIGLVTQETLLFMDSIHDNIAYGKPAVREAVMEAARKAQAHDFIMNLPNGYDTLLAETGASISGGQRQRLAIARAILQDPPILILDEATSALDTENERAVQQALEALMQNRTALVIAHRLSTVQRATRICVLKHGRIIETGTHEDLLAKGAEYARLYALQFHEV